MLKHIKDRAGRILKNADVQRAISWASETSRRVRENVGEARKQLTEALSVEGRDDLQSLKRKLDRMTESQNRVAKDEES